MKTLLLAVLLFITSINVYANNYSAENTFCDWLGNASSVIAQNKDQGLSETDMISNYLKQQHRYEEQLIIIPLIDRVYKIERDLTSDEIAFIEKRQCLIGMANNS